MQKIKQNVLKKICILLIQSEQRMFSFSELKTVIIIVIWMLKLYELSQHKHFRSQWNVKRGFCSEFCIRDFFVGISVPFWNLGFSVRSYFCEILSFRSFKFRESARLRRGFPGRSAKKNIPNRRNPKNKTPNSKFWKWISWNENSEMIIPKKVWIIPPSLYTHRVNKMNYMRDPDFRPVVQDWFFSVCFLTST